MSVGCVSDQRLFAIDHSELQAVDGISPTTLQARQYRVELATERAQILRVKQCDGRVHVEFDDKGTGYRYGELQVLDAYLADNALEGVVVVTGADGTESEHSFHATAMR